MNGTLHYLNASLLTREDGLTCSNLIVKKPSWRIGGEFKPQTEARRLSCAQTQRALMVEILGLQIIRTQMPVVAMPKLSVITRVRGLQAALVLSPQMPLSKQISPFSG